MVGNDKLVAHLT